MDRETRAKDDLTSAIKHIESARALARKAEATFGLYLLDLAETELYARLDSAQAARGS